MNIDNKFAETKKLTADGTEAVRKLAADGAVQTRAMIDQANGHATRTTEGLVKAAEEAAEFGRANLDAMTRSAQAYSNGLQEIGRHSMASMQALTEQTIEAAKAIASSKSLKDAADLHAAFVRSTIDRAMAEQAKLQDAVLKTAEAAMAPISARLGAAMDRAARPLAV